MMILANWSEFFSKIWNHPARTTICIAVICALLLLWILRLASKRRRHFTVHCADGGEIKISRNALHDLVSNASRDALPIRKPKVSFKARRGRLSLDLKVRIQSGKKLETVYQELKVNLTRVLEETLGSEHIGEVKLIISGFEPAPARSVSTMNARLPAERDTPHASAEDEFPSNDSDPDEDDNQRS